MGTIKTFVHTLCSASVCLCKPSHEELKYQESVYQGQTTGTHTVLICREEG